MTGNEPETADDIEDDEDDWMKYANAGFGETDYSLSLIHISEPTRP